MGDANVGWDDIDAIAVVYGPGLAGSLLVGLNAAKALSFAHNIPLVGVNHMEGHVYANWPLEMNGQWTHETPPSFPLVCLVVSGGHTNLILVTDHHTYHSLGRTIDDAAGEAFDKVSRLLGLGYPGGPAIQRAAADGDSAAYSLPRALQVGPYDFSFSGLKTAVLRLVQDLQRDQGMDVDVRGQKLADAGVEPGQDGIPVADIAASFQEAVVDALVTKLALAVKDHGAVQALLAGGVAANKLLRERASGVGVPVRYPPIALCTDNAVMVAVAGHYAYLNGVRSGLDLDVVPNLALV